MGSTIAIVEKRLDAEAVKRVLRRAHEIAAANGTVESALDPGGVSPEALIAAADDVGIDPAAVRESIALERFAHDIPAAGRLDRLAGASEVSVQRTIAREVTDVLDAVEEWLTLGYQMRCSRTSDTTIESRPRTGIGASLSRAATEFTDDEDIQPVDRIVVEAHRRDGADAPATMVRITAIRRTTRARRLGGAGAAGAVGVAATVVGVVEAVIWWPVAGVGLIGGALLVARSGNTHAERVEVEMEHLLSAVARAERPTGLAGRAARRVRAAMKSVRSKD